MGAQEFNTIDVVRLEIEKDPTGLVNRVQNPSGELGGWGWVTPLAGTAIRGAVSGGVQLLRYTGTTTAGDAEHFYTEPMSVAAGRYVAARWNNGNATPLTMYYRAKFEWLNAAQAVIGSSTVSAYLPATAAAVTYGPHLAPVGTAYVRLRFDLYANNTGTNPAAGTTTFPLWQVTVADAATSGAFGPVRTNLITNPSFETNTAGWSCSKATLTSSSTAAVVGTKSLRAQVTVAAGPVGVITNPRVTVAPNTSYSFRGQIRPTAANRVLKLVAVWYDAGGAVISSAAATPVAGTANTWTALTLAATSPAGTATVSLELSVQDAMTGSLPLSELFYCDAVAIEQAATVQTYFDGATADAGGWDYAWTGTAHASMSTATNSALQYLDPVQYLNVIAESHEIRVRRNALNVGELSATIVSTALDPSQATLIRPGRRARLTTLISGVWETVMVGKLLEADVSYDLKNPKLPDLKRAQIQVLILDATQALANAKRPEGVATIDELPFVLEGAGVPWNVNGSGNQVAAADVTTYNDGAFALNQVALTRDTALGYAWMSRLGVMNVWDNALIPAGTLVLDESDYSDLNVSFSTKDCINEVTVVVQSVGVDGTTVETSYGPFQDAASIEEWGPFSKTFTVTGLDAVAAEALADAVLAANGTPRVRVNSVTLPLTTLARVAEKSLIDLYDQVNVTNVEKDLDDDLRVTSIEHVIDTNAWMVTLAFADEGGVASPVFQPPVQSGTRPDVGVIEMFAGPTGNIPATKLLCNGASHLVADYPYLFAVIGYTFGGAGASFNVPNLTDRFPIGSGTKALGTTGGAATHTHALSDNGQAQIYSTGANVGVRRISTPAFTTTHVTNGTAGTNGSSAVGAALRGATDSGGDLNPWLSLNFVIRAA